MLSLGVLAAAFYCKKRKGVMTKLDVRERKGGGGMLSLGILAAAFYCKKWKGVMTKSQGRCQAQCAFR